MCVFYVRELEEGENNVERKAELVFPVSAYLDEVGPQCVSSPSTDTTQREDWSLCHD